MPHFRDAYEQLTSDHMLLNTHGPGEATFEMFWTTDRTNPTADLRLMLDNRGAVVRSVKFEGWQVETDAEIVLKHVSQHGFTTDEWRVVPILPDQP